MPNECVFPATPQAQAALALAAMAQEAVVTGRFHDACGYLIAVTKIAGNAVGCASLIAQCLHRMMEDLTKATEAGRQVEALRILDQIAATQIQFPVNLLRARLLVELGMLEFGRQALIEEASRDPENAEVRAMLQSLDKRG